MSNCLVLCTLEAKKLTYLSNGKCLELLDPVRGATAELSTASWSLELW